MGSQSAGTSFAVVDESGNVVASFTSAVSYACALVTAPGIQSGSSYTLVCGGAVSDADDNGFATSGTVSGGTTVTTVDMTSNLYATSGLSMGGMMGGMGQMGGMGGHGGPGHN